MEQIFRTIYSFGNQKVMEKNLLPFRDNYGRQLFLFNIKFFSSCLSNNSRLYFERYRTSYKIAMLINIL